MRRIGHLRGPRRLQRDTTGAAAIEFALIAPLLMLLLFGSLTLFTGWREVQRDEKAAFTVADLISRRTSVDYAFLKNANAIFDHIVLNAGSPIRVTSLTKQQDKYTVQWSYAVGSFAKMTDAEIPADRIPEIAVGDTLIVTETQSPRLPLMAFMPSTEDLVQTFVTTRPRFVAAISKSDE